MFSRKYRITNSADFDYLFQKGYLRSNSLFYLKFLPNKLSYSRFGFVVGVKLFKEAVKRNRVKRLMREFVRSNLTKIRGGYDIVVGVKSRKFYGIKYEEAEKLLSAFFDNNNFLE
ncbi:MAG: ribonuclease P protein component [Parcubacteria group bacterium GW2011_GWA2_38_13b]|nr:MAG: ribonuclease P protein component [Parcubacteria group bacterium GW2011_GWA2_38_13b]